MKIALFVFFMTINLVFGQSSLVINEFVASNINTYRDENYNFNDWIEIYNGSGATVDIGGMYISDDSNEIDKWQLPTGSELTIIEPDSFLILWADGDPGAGVLHLDFKLSSSGEQIILTASDGIAIVDSLSFPQQTANYSYGRSSADPDIFKFFIKPTPGMPNGLGYNGVVDAPVIEMPSGNYPGSIEASVTNSDLESTLYYTTDGSTPIESSMPYTIPVSIGNSSVFSVRAYKDGYIPSQIVSKSYFINQDFNLPVLSIVTDPPNLFSDSIGIYVNYYGSSAYWERPISGHYFKDDSAHSFTGGIRIQGRTSRKLAKKSFRLFFKTGYGQERLEYDMFKMPDVKSFKNLVTRPGYDDDISPSNSLGTLLRDPLASEGWKKNGGLTSEGNWAIMYINNDYWGIYNIRESINDFFIMDHLGFKDFDLIRYDKKGPLVQHGTIEAWDFLWNFIEEQDLSLSENYQVIEDNVDINNLLSFQAMVQCTQYRSWTWGAYAFKEKGVGGKWQWAPWDMDRAYTNQSWNGITIYQNTNAELWGNLMVQKLLLNDSFKSMFINRVSDFLNFYYTAEKTTALIDSLAGIIEAEIPAEADRWDSSVEKWNSNVDRLRDFADNRPDIVFQQMQNYFGLSTPNEITVEIANNAGKLKINSIIVESGWTGKYFPENEIQVSAIANPGFKFVGWSDESLPADPDISITLTENITLEPLFEQLPTSDYFEIIAPSVVKTSENLPVIVRSRKPSGEMKTIVGGDFSITNNASFSDSTFKIKKGTGTLLANVTSPSSFSIRVDYMDFASETKNINVFYPLSEEHHSGTLPGGVVTWEDVTEHIIDSDITVPEGTTLEINAGARVLLLEHVNIIVNGTLQINGTKENPVLFISADTSYAWGGIEFYGSVSNVQYCFFVNGGGDPAKIWHTSHTETQPVLFARSSSDLNLDNVYILNAPGKALGATQSILNMNQSVIANMFHGGEFSYSRIHVNNSYIMDIPNDDGEHIDPEGDDDNDGFHMDHNYSGGGESIIENSFFIDGKDDGIDQNRKNLTIKNCWIEGWLNEGVATSGGDTVKIINTVSSNCTNGFEAGNGTPQMIIDHSVVFNNQAGFRFGDNYLSLNAGHMTITNSIAFNNERNLHNYTKDLRGPRIGAIDITYSMTNDTVYNDSLGNITGVPEFDENYYLLPTSPGASAGINGTNMGLVDEIPPVASQIIINEIMYKPDDNHDTKDWVEIYNPANQAKNISGWILKDQDNETPFTLPHGTIIDGKGFLVLCEDTSSFKIKHPSITNIIGNFEFGYSRDTDKVRLFSPNGHAIDSVEYSSSGSWPASPDGTGPSLELKDPFKENNTSGSWIASKNIGGTPGYTNSILTNIKDDDDPEVPDIFRLHQNYPNPFNPQTSIKYQLAAGSKVKLSIYDITGRLVKTVINAFQQSGEHQVIFDAKNLASGIYIYRLEAGKFITQKKMLFLK